MGYRNQGEIDFIATYLAELNYADVQRIARRHGIAFSIPLLGKHMWDGQANFLKVQMLKQKLDDAPDAAVQELYMFVRTAA